MNLFGKKKSAPARPTNTAGDAIQQLNTALENLDKREAHIQKTVDKEMAKAKELMQQKNKKGALNALKRKKMYESQIEKINGTRLTIENQKMALENANFNRSLLSAMSSGAQALGQVTGDMTIDRVDETMDEVQEQMDLANEISEAISQPVGGYEDDAELEAELAELEAEGLDETLLSMDAAPLSVGNNTAVADEPLDLPSVPTTTTRPAPAKTDEDKELEALVAGMAV